MNWLSLGLGRAGLEIKQFVRSRESFTFTLLFPVILLVVLGSIFRWTIEGTDVRMSQYLAAGLIGSGLLNTGFQALAITIPIERDKGALKRLRGTPMPPAAYFVGKVLMVLALAAAEIVLLLAVGCAFYGLRLPRGAGSWLTFGWVGLLGITACTLCGIAFSSLPRTGRGASALVTPVALVLQFISGVFVLSTQLPGWMQQAAAVFPLRWICQGMRAVFLPAGFAAQERTGSWELGRVALVLAAWCVVGLVLCLGTFRWTNRGER
jgi:ABC-2 type transport system permease protein